MQLFWTRHAAVLCYACGCAGLHIHAAEVCGGVESLPAGTGSGINIDAAQMFQVATCTECDMTRCLTRC